MRKRSILAAVLAAGCILCSAGISASAYTIDDVVRKSREVGIPEAQIQTGINNWNTSAYDQAELDAIYLNLEAYGEDSWFYIQQYFLEEMGGTMPPTETPTEPVTDPVSGEPVQTAPPAETAPPKDFISMTLAEKQAFLNSMSPEDKEQYLANLTPAEKNSILKQMSLEDQAALLQKYIDLAKQMGINVSVDSLSEEGIAVTMRDNEGIVIDKTQTGITIDPTGISYDGLLIAAALSVLLAACGFSAVYRHLCRTEQAN